MIIFYNIAGGIICLIALLMLRCGKVVDENKPELHTVAKVLHIIYLITGVSMFTAQFEPRLNRGDFEMFNPLMLLFFYLAAHGFIYTVLLLYKSKSAQRYPRRLLPSLALFGIYTIAYFGVGDEQIYTQKDFFTRLPQTPMLIFRLLLYLMAAVSVIRGIRLCNYESREHHKRTALALPGGGIFEFDILISKYMWSIKAIALWFVLTQCYTTSVLEVVSCSLIAVVFWMQFAGFRKYSSPPHIATMRLFSTSGEIDFEVTQQEAELKRRLMRWSAREDKPFIRTGIAIAEVAKEIGVSKNRFSAYVNSQDINFRTWINNLRIEEAKRLLAECKTMTISEIAEYTGFCDLPAFSRAFKKHTGISPKTFREETGGLST